MNCSVTDFDHLSIPQDISGVPSVKRRKLQPKSDALKAKAGTRKPRNRVEIEYEVEAEPKQRERIHK